MKQEVNILKSEIKKFSNKFLEKIQDKEIEIVSHFDTDGISSAAIVINSLKKLDKKFKLKIVKNLEREFILELPKDKVILFLDLASGSLNHIKEAELNDVFILDHHEIKDKIPEGINIVNPEIFKGPKISGSGLSYFFSKEINEESKEMVKLAILGMIGDALENKINEIFEEEINEFEMIVKKGILIYPSTRPLNKTLEFCSDPIIEGVTGNPDGIIELLRESEINPVNGKYKNLIDLNEDEMKKLTTNIMLRNPKIKNKKLIGDIFLLKFFGKLEDAREISAKINACSRFGESEVALMFCLESQNAKKRADEIHAKYKQLLIEGLKKIEKLEKIEGKGFAIINANKEVKDTMIGTITSILSYSPIYEEETVIIGLAKYDDKIKVSARNVGDKGRNTKQILEEVVKITGGEVGGHESASGCIISQSKEKEFLELLKKNLELQVVKIN
jgi:RecJ-like exonuclease